ncbi:hypothetical protein T484DRAFT_1826557 [Baffinella frigidus]|nr:hypothetical protein T484DRAFT_1826557 [Cryptophyta sp. CCMP2293]
MDDGGGGVASKEDLEDENKRLKAELAAMRESMTQRLQPEQQPEAAAVPSIPAPADVPDGHAAPIPPPPSPPPHVSPSREVEQGAASKGGENLGETLSGGGERPARSAAGKSAGGKGEDAAHSVPYGEEEYTWSWLTVTGTWREYEPRVCEVVEQAFQTGQKQARVCSSESTVVYFHDMEQRDVLTDSPGMPRPVRRHRSFCRSSALEQLRRRNKALREAKRKAQVEERSRIEATLATAHRPDTSSDDKECSIGCRMGFNSLTGEVYVAHMEPRGAAGLSGSVALGDVLVSIDSVPVASVEDAATRLLGRAATVVTLALAYAGKSAGGGAGREADCGVEVGLHRGEV